MRDDRPVTQISQAREPEAPQAWVVSLRGELWRRHAELRDIGPEDIRYTDAVSELLDLTATLLVAESAVQSAERAARRRAGLILYLVALLAASAAVALVVLMPGLGPTVSRMVIGAVLLIIVAVVIVLIRQRRSWRDLPPPGTSPGWPGNTEPATGPLVTSASGPAEGGQ
jgi:hypothetical protein